MRKYAAGIGANIILLGMVSFLADVSSEMMMPILPMFIATLGGGAVAVGLIGGLGDSITSLLQILSGYWSDRYGRRKPFVIGGYTVSAVAKSFLALATVWQHVLIARPLDRVGKGLRTAPRDAIIAESAMSTVRGKAFGVHRAMDTAGAIVGSLLALLFFWSLGMSMKTILLVSAVVAFFALPPLFWVRERKRKPQSLRLRISLAVLPPGLRWFVLIATVFALGNFTYMFFILKAQAFFSETLAERTAMAIPILLYVLFNTVYTLFAIPFGILSDTIGRLKVLLIGYFLFGVTCVGFALASSLAVFALLFCLYGLVYALVEGNQRAFASDLASGELRGTALGTFHTFVGLAALPASLTAGALWQSVSSDATFVYGATLAFLASALLLAGKARVGEKSPW